MYANIANIAEERKSDSCDIRDCRVVAESAMIAAMDVVDAEWIKAKLSGRHGEQARLAERMGIDQDKLSKILKGVRRVQAAEVPRVVAFFEDQSEEPENKVPKLEIADLASEAREDALVPVYDVAASAGHGANVDDYEAIAFSLAFPQDYLRRVTRASLQNLAIISVKGDSMEPTLKDDDVVMLDRSKTNLSYDGLFVLRFGEALHVKRVTRAAKPGHITIISDNRDAYPMQEWPEDQVSVIGKVIWVGGKV